MRPYLLFTLFSAILCASLPANGKEMSLPVSFGDSSTVSFTTMDELLLSIEKTLGTRYHYILRAADVNNMEARKLHHKREIRYNPSFVKYVAQSTRDKWGVIFLLAHEIAHHELGHTSKRTGSRPSVELEADEFAGALL